MVLGSYYLTLVKSDEKGANKIFRDKNEAIMAYNDGIVGLHAPIRVRMTNDKGEHGLVWCTVGFIIFNESIPQDLGFVDRTDPKHLTLNGPIPLKIPTLMLLRATTILFRTRLAKSSSVKLLTAALQCTEQANPL